MLQINFFYFAVSKLIANLLVNVPINFFSKKILQLYYKIHGVSHNIFHSYRQSCIQSRLGLLYYINYNV